MAMAFRDQFIGEAHVTWNGGPESSLYASEDSMPRLQDQSVVFDVTHQNFSRF